MRRPSLRPALTALLVLSSAQTAAQPTVAQPVTATEVTQADSRLRALSATSRVDLVEARRALEAFSVVDGLVQRSMQAGRRFEPEAARVLKARLGATPGTIERLVEPVRGRCRASARRAHALGREMLRCFGAAKSPLDQRIGAARLGELPAEFTNGDLDETAGLYALAVSSLASTREPESRISLLRALATMEISVGDLKGAELRLVGLDGRPEQEVVRADLQWVRGDTAGALERLRVLTAEFPSSGVAHLALARCAFNSRWSTDTAPSSTLETVTFDHARAAVCVVEQPSLDGIRHAGVMLQWLMSHGYGEPDWAWWWLSDQRSGPTLLPAESIPAAWLPPRLRLDPDRAALETWLDPHRAALETCRALLDRIAPGARLLR